MLPDVEPYCLSLAWHSKVAKGATAKQEAEMSTEQIQMAVVATQKSYRRMTDWVIALAILIAVCIALATWLVQSRDNEVAGTASFSSSATAHARALNEPSSLSTDSTVTLTGVQDARALNGYAPRGFVQSIGDVRALNEVASGPALALGAVVDGRALNEPESTYSRFMPSGPGR